MWDKYLFQICFRIPKMRLLLTLAGTRHFAIPDGTRGDANPLGVSKVSVVGLSGKYQRIALDEYSRLVVRFLP